MQAHMFWAGALWICFHLFVGVVVMLNYFQVVEQYVHNITIIITHCTTSLISVIFVYRRIHEAKTGHEVEACIKLYRCIQIMEKLLNAFLMVRIVPVMVAGMPGLQILTQYVCIKMHEEISMPGFLIFPLVFGDSTVNNVLVFTLASWINNISAKVLMQLGNKMVNLDASRMGLSILRRKIKACTVLKIKFGSNFIDRGTPLVIQNFCLNQTMTLILIKSSRLAAKD